MKQEERSQETRSRILAAAAENFARQGYDVTSVDAICRLAGVSKGAFYHHFPSKSSVFIALLGAWLDRMDQRFAAAQAQGGGVPEQIAAMADDAAGIFQVAGGNWNILLEFWTKAKTEPEVAASMVATLRRYQVLFESLLARGVSEGSLRGGDTTLGAGLLLSVVLGTLLQGLLDPQGQEWGSVLQRELAQVMTWMHGRDT